eukprot:24343_1
MTLSPSSIKVEEPAFDPAILKDVILYNKTEDVGAFDYSYHFGFRDILMRDIIKPISKIEEIEFQKTSELSPDDYNTFREALELLSDFNLLSYHLYMVATDDTYNDNEKAQTLLENFKEDLKAFRGGVDNFKRALAGKAINKDSISPNRKTYKNKKAPSPVKDFRNSQNSQNAQNTQNSNNDDNQTNIQQETDKENDDNNNDNNDDTEHNENNNNNMDIDNPPTTPQPPAPIKPEENEKENKEKETEKVKEIS